MSENKTDIDVIRAEIKRAVRYKDGPGMMNTVYLGSLATAHIMRCLGSRYGQDSLQKAIDKASNDQIMKVYEYEGYQWILNHYKKAGSKLYEYDVTSREVN